MPAQRPRAQFEPIPPNLNLEALVEPYSHFDFCTRINYTDIAKHGVDQLERLVRKHVIQDGKPLVIDGWHERLDQWTFSARWLKDNMGDKVENARDLKEKKFIPLTMAHYLKSIPGVTNQHFKSTPERPPQRIYLKDIDCPEVWQQKLAEVLPPFLYYLNDSTGEWGGPGAKLLHNSTVPGRRLGKGIAPAGDLMSSLPVEMRAENLMCYIGHEGTYTPAHREMCATMGHNIMVEASSDFDDEGKPEKTGSSIWFMTEAKDRQAVAEYWLSKLGHDIEVESHFAQINSWKLAPFKVHIVEQRPGDLILIPPLAPHQVWNRGTRTMKVAWNRTTPETLEMAMTEALPKARVVCRDEQYKNKAIIYFTLCKYSELLQDAKSQADKLPPEAGHALLYGTKIRRLQREFRKLFVLFKDIMLSEMFAPDAPSEECEFLPFESNVTCAYCRGNIFNRFLSCPTCSDGLGHSEDEPYDVCMECYAMGRSCYCISGHKFVEQFKWKELLSNYDHWRKQLIELSGETDRGIPLALHEERRRLRKRTLAEVVKEQLKKRPFQDPSNPQEPDDELSEEEIVVDNEGRVKKQVKKRSKAWLKSHSVCHVCRTRHENWKMAQCTRCDRTWCYGSLFRGHDDMPLDIMEDPDWECAHCLGICFAGGKCRQDPQQVPFQPKGTLLGHDTKKVADARSVEALVDFSVSNLQWLREDENSNGETAQMRYALQEAEKARNTQADEEEDHDAMVVDQASQPPPTSAPAEDDFLDPELRAENDLAARLNQFNATHPDLINHADFHNVSIGMTEDDQLHDAIDADESHEYPNPDDIHGETRPFRKKKGDDSANRKRLRLSEGDEITMIMPKKHKRVTEQGDMITARATNDANKQYQTMKEKKALEEARRTGRFISVNAALRGRKRVVKLKITSAALRDTAAKVAKQTGRRVTFAAVDKTAARPADQGLGLLQSDVNTGKPSTTSQRPRKKKKTSETDDEADDAAIDGFEGDSDGNFDQGGGAYNPAKRVSTDGRRHMSAYQRAKHADDDDDLPDALPDSFRDSRKSMGSSGADRSHMQLPARNDKGVFQGANKPTKSIGTGRPRGRPPKNHAPRPAAASSPIVIANDSPHPKLDGTPTGTNQRGPSVTEQELNRLAKLEALKTLDDDGGHDGNVDDNNAEDSDDGADAVPAKVVAPAGPAAADTTAPRFAAPVAKMGRRSILSGPGGRKIKIVSAAKLKG